VDPSSERQVRITHPFHPLRDQRFRLVVTKLLWGEERVTLEHPDASLHSVPVGWTDARPPDPYLQVGRGRSRFRVEDLLGLVDLVRGAARRDEGAGK
jgi:hypothetical protein